MTSIRVGLTRRIVLGKRNKKLASNRRTVSTVKGLIVKTIGSTSMGGSDTVAVKVVGDVMLEKDGVATDTVNSQLNTE